jgi:hypothetical protein
MTIYRPKYKGMFKMVQIGFRQASKDMSRIHMKDATRDGQNFF